jgi:hypothetical protein
VSLATEEDMTLRSPSIRFAWPTPKTVLAAESFTSQEHIASHEITAFENAPTNVEFSKIYGFFLLSLSEFTVTTHGYVILLDDLAATHHRIHLHQFDFTSLSLTIVPQQFTDLPQNNIIAEQCISPSTNRHYNVYYWLRDAPEQLTAGRTILTGRFAVVL